MLYPTIKNPGVKTINDFEEETTGRPKLSTPKNTLFRLLYKISCIVMKEDGPGRKLFLTPASDS